MAHPGIEIKTYKRFADCFKAYFYPGKVPQKGYWRWMDENGKKRQLCLKKTIAAIKANKCWGWLEKKTIIHLWIGAGCNDVDIIRLIAHELGHAKRPFHRSLKEEMKAEKYASVAELAFLIMEDVKKRGHNQFL